MPGIKPWVVPGLSRTPDELQMFLFALQEIEGEVWNAASQILFQIILIQKYWHFHYNSHFTEALAPRGLWSVLDDDHNIPFALAERLLMAKGYADPTRRSRVAFNSLEQMGFAIVNRDNGLVTISPAGRQLLDPSADLGNIFLRQLFGWQLPNPIEPKYPAKLGYRIKPFVGTLHLIRQVNIISAARGLNISGLSLDEFDAFVPTLIDYREIYQTALKVVDVRVDCLGLAGEERENRQNSLIGEYIQGFDTRRLKAYGEHTRRYFRLTRFLRYRGDGQFIDLEPLRDIEITATLGY